jgi:hypothetical protein
MMQKALAQHIRPLLQSCNTAEQRSTLAVPTLWIFIPLAGVRGKMWMHPATVANVEILRQRGANFIGPEKGMLACGYEGIGRLLAGRRNRRQSA